MAIYTPDTNPAPDELFAPGDYEKKGDGAIEGRCAGCCLRVAPNEPSVIRYHPLKIGGLFHAHHAPTGPQWFGVDAPEARGK